MGAHVLILALLALLLGCAAPSGERDPHAHDALSCNRCHAGGLAAKGLAGVDSGSCTTVGCHPDGGPEAARLDLVQFSHRGHGRDADTPPGCAGCHGHDEGEDPLRASLDSCVLCHRDDIVQVESRDCLLCHGEAVHTEVTSQGAPVRHAWSRNLENRCLRCHYDVGDAPIDVAVDRCTDCHAASEDILRVGAGVDLHPSHGGFGCQRCHGPTSHRVRAMSSAVSLACADCHADSHAEDEDIAGTDPVESCRECHDGVHVQQQQLLLGLVDQPQDRPSHKFMAGLSCRSCHRGEPGGPDACRDCHDPSYTRVLDWWLEGLSVRESLVRADVERARRSLAGRSEAVERVASADSLLSLVEIGGGVHNLELSDWIFHRSVELVGEAFHQAGVFRPQPPSLGNRARDGFCT
ncbi:MAG: cytochrome c3 family protein, partial [Gemmatimonadetes bacterium]|nr:cytochrome c3 family protein [Gemmatimonadota bacterium]